MLETLQRICALQPTYSSSNTPEMQERGHLVRHELAEAMRGLVPRLRLSFDASIADLDIEASDGIGRKTEAPWVRLFSRSRSPTPREGYYLVLHFAADGSAVFVTVGCGSTIWSGGDLRPVPDSELQRRTNWARSVILQRWGTLAPFTDQIALGARANLPRTFEKATAIAKRIGVERLALVGFEDLLAEASARLSAVYLAQDLGRDDFYSGTEALEIERIVNPSKSRRNGQGFGLTAEEKRAVDRQAMFLARQHLEALGYNCEDKSADHSFDFLVARDGESVKVEVKGTTADSCAAVLMTRNEVDLHRAEAGHTALLIVTSIRLERHEGGVRGSGGEVEALIPWRIDDWDAQPVGFQVFRQSGR